MFDAIIFIDLINFISMMINIISQ